MGGVGPEAVWRGMTTIAGSWIGGGANQAAMLEIFGASPELFTKMIAVDVIVANIWTGFLLFGAGRSAKVDKLFNADASAIEQVKKRMEDFRLSVSKIPKLSDTMVILGFGFGVTAFSHLIGNFIAPWLLENAPGLEKFSLTSSFFWLIVIATTLGILLSFTKAKNLEGVGSGLGGLKIGRAHV